jgi:UDP-glucose 4-epimerase
MTLTLSDSERHYLITGGAGFIGSHLAEALLADGHMVTVIDDLSTGRMENIAHLTGRSRFRFAIDTITNSLVMDRLVSECDAVYHLAAAVGVELIVTDPVHTIETNVLGTHAVLQAAARYRKKVLLASTSEIYGKGVRVPFAEDDDRVLGPTTKSRWSYSDSKAIDEFLGLAYYKQHGLPVIITRFFNTVGPRQTGQYGMVIPRFVGQALAGKALTVYGDGQQSRCFCNVADVVAALKGLIVAPEAVGEVFNVGSTEEITILELARRILAATGRDADAVQFIPYAEAYEPGFEDMERRVPDVSKIARAIGWRPTTPLDETLRQVIAYEKTLKRSNV